jgi:hypothetical protein
MTSDEVQETESRFMESELDLSTAHPNVAQME